MNRMIGKVSVLSLLALTCSGCFDVIYTVKQVVEFRVVERKLSKPVTDIGGTWSRNGSLPVAFARTDAAGISRMSTKHTGIAGAGIFPFSLFWKSNVESIDHLSGSNIEVVVVDGHGGDVCKGVFKPGTSISGNRYLVEFVSVGKAKMIKSSAQEGDIPVAAAGQSTPPSIKAPPSAPARP